MKFQYRIAYRLIFSRLQQALGGRVRWMTASGAPTSREIVLFFNAAGITREFSQEMGELTPSLKLRRKVVLENFAR